MLKKTSLISAYSTLQCCNICTPTSTTSPFHLPCPRARPPPQRPPPSKWRSYATAARDSKGPDFRDNMNWPCRKQNPWQPSPYDIFDIDRTATYNKHKYYELVKLYHPDKSAHHDITQLSHFERLERYRLVVQAHEILSDPIKRRAYDAYGAGWGDRSGSVSRHSRGYKNPDGQTYGYGRDQDDSPFGNATWEDWERWYRRRDNPNKQEYAGTYVNPNAFASFVILLAVLTGVLQATRAGQYSSSLGEKVQAFTEETNQFLNTRAQTLSENKLGSDGRIKHFLERRDPSRYGLKDEEEETYRKHFAAQQGGHLLPPPGKNESKKAETIPVAEG